MRSTNFLQKKKKLGVSETVLFSINEPIFYRPVVLLPHLFLSDPECLFANVVRATCSISVYLSSIWTCAKILHREESIAAGIMMKRGIFSAGETFQFELLIPSGSAQTACAETLDPTLLAVTQSSGTLVTNEMETSTKRSIQYLHFCPLHTNPSSQSYPPPYLDILNAFNMNSFFCTDHERIADTVNPSLWLEWWAYQDDWVLRHWSIT